jgi:hypothetical protein
MVLDLRLRLGKLALLGISLGCATSSPAQTAVKLADIAGAYKCSSGSVTQQRLTLSPGGRWSKYPRFFFSPAWLSSRRDPFHIGSSPGKIMLLEPDSLLLQGLFSREKDRVVLYPETRSWQGFFNQFVPVSVVTAVQQFRIDPASGNLIEVPFFFRPPLICTRDGFL